MIVKDALLVAFLVPRVRSIGRMPAGASSKTAAGTA
jgi:hypothetical protein